MNLEEAYRKKSFYSSDEKSIDAEIKNLKEKLSRSKHSNIYLALGMLYNAKYRKNLNNFEIATTAEKYFEMFLD